ncbi:MAG: site-specific integrase [Candidatus Bathyarchaeia archaeon]
MEDLNLDPDSFLALDPKEARDRAWSVIQKWVSKERYNFAEIMKYAIKNFYNFYNEDKRLEWRVRVHTISVPLKRSKRIPTHEEIYRIIDATHNLRDKAIIALMYHTGLGNEAIVNLNYGDVKNLLEREDYPLELRIDSRIYPKRVKSGYYYVLFDKDCADLLKQYCNKVHKNSCNDRPLFLTNDGRRMRIRGVTWQINEAMKRVLSKEKSEKTTWPYLLRDAFYNRLVEGGMKDVHREYLMGHSLGIRHHYFGVNLKELKGEYSKCHFNRGESKLEEIEKLERQLEEERKRRLELEERITTEKLTRLILEALKDPRLRKYVVSVYESTIPPEVWPAIKEQYEKERKKTAKDNKDCDELVSKEQLPLYLRQGWKFVAKVDDDLCVVRR